MSIDESRASSLRTASSHGRRGGVSSAGVDKFADKYGDDAGHVAAAVEKVIIDCTNRGTQLVEDHLVKVKFTLGHLSMETVDIDRVKGKMNVELTSSTGDVEVVVKLSWRMKFEVMWQGKKHRGHLLLESITREMLMLELVPFPLGIQWLNDKSPKGMEFNQVTAILRSSRCREKIRSHYVDMEKQLIKEFMPRFQKQRTTDYLNQEGKKRAIFDLSQVSEDLVASRTGSRKSSAYTPTTKMKKNGKKDQTERFDHDEETGVALGEIGEYHGMAPSHRAQLLQDFAFGDAGSVGSVGSSSMTAGSIGAGSIHTAGSASAGGSTLGTPHNNSRTTTAPTGGSTLGTPHNNSRTTTAPTAGGPTARTQVPKVSQT